MNGSGFKFVVVGYLIGHPAMIFSESNPILMWLGLVVGISLALYGNYRIFFKKAEHANTQRPKEDKRSYNRDTEAWRRYLGG